MESFLPDSISFATALIFIVASFFTSALTASFGIGGGIALMALMGTVLPVASLIPVHGFVQLGSNSGRAWHQRAYVIWPKLFPFMAGAVIGAIIGATTVIQLPDRPMKLGLGIFILIVTWLKLPALGAMRKNWVALSGAFVAFLSMIFGATGPLLASFFEKAFPDRKEMVATVAVGNVVVHGLKVVAFAFAGFEFGDWLALILAMIISGYAGTISGTRLLHRIPEHCFRTGFKIVLSVLALDMVSRGISP